MARRATYRANAGAAMTANGDYTINAGQSDELSWAGGKGFFYTVGTWAGSTAKLQMLAPDGATWVDLGLPVTLSANGMGAFEAPAGQLRVDVAAGGVGLSLKSWVVGVPSNIGG